MLITAANLDLMFRGFSTAFNKGFGTAPTFWRDIAMEIPSSTREQNYGWLAQLPKLREWVGDRVINSLAVHGYAIKNKKYESTIAIGRDDIEDDQYGVFGPLVSEMGQAAAEHPDEILGALLASGFTTLCFDGLSFFNAAHPIAPFSNTSATASNVQTGSGAPWFLLDTTRAIKPLIWQSRVPYQFQQLTEPSEEHVFMKDEYVYGIRCRDNAGFGLWQTAFASNAALEADNYEAARKTMMELKGDSGRPLGIKPNVLVASPELEGDAMRLLNNGMRFVTPAGQTVPVAVTNEWKDTAKPIITAWVLP